MCNYRDDVNDYVQEPQYPYYYDDSTESLEAPEFRDDDDGLEMGTFGCWGEDSPRAIVTAILCAVGLIAAALSVALFVEWLLR